MTPLGIKEARQTLGLTVRQFAAILETDGQTVRRMEMDQAKSTARTPAVRMVRLIQAYFDGYRPADWPEKELIK
jgi:DNA-binding transcriptional regulator YiaG